MLDEILNWLGLKRRDPRTIEEQLEELRLKAEDAEKLQKQTEDAWSYRQRISKANAARQKVLLQAKGGSSGPNLGQIVMIICGLAVFVLFVKTCI